MIFHSKYAAFTVNVRPPLIQYHPVTGTEIGKIPALAANFGNLGPEYEYTDPVTERIEKAAHITGYYFDSVVAQEQNDWSDEERESVEARLLALCKRWPEAIWLHSTPVAQKPWPKYDEIHHNSIPQLAEQLGLVVEALAYERENKNRDSVIQKLEELLQQDTVAEELSVA